jgi:hypothetical protein
MWICYVTVNALSGCACVCLKQDMLLATGHDFVCRMSPTKKRWTADVICIVFCVVPYMYRWLLSIVTKSGNVYSVALLAVIALDRWTWRFGSSLLCSATVRHCGCRISCQHLHGSWRWSDRKCGSSHNMSMRGCRTLQAAGDIGMCRSDSWQCLPRNNWTFRTQLVKVIKDAFCCCSIPPALWAEAAPVSRASRRQCARCHHGLAHRAGVHRRESGVHRQASGRWVLLGYRELGALAGWLELSVFLGQQKFTWQRAVLLFPECTAKFCWSWCIMLIMSRINPVKT